MTESTAFVIRYVFLLLALGLGCATGPTALRAWIRPAPLGDAATAQLDRHASAPASAGELVYDGTVYELDADPSAAPLFAYQRRVRDLGDVREATHVTRAPDGVLLSISVISMRAKQAIVRAAVPPMRLVFDTATRKVLRYEGRVPPKVAKGHALRPLDARVEYAYASATYR
jgi:hypothetical protein